MPKFGAKSRRQLEKAHPLLQQLFNEVIKRIDCQVLESQRGKAAQEEAFAKGNSRAHFGQSAHNWSPAIALDVVPYPLSWTNIPSFKRLAKVVKQVALELNIPIVWGGDWTSIKDMPHYELGPDWRVWAKKSKPYGGA